MGEMHLFRLLRIAWNGGGWPRRDGMRRVNGDGSTGWSDE